MNSINRIQKALPLLGAWLCCFSAAVSALELRINAGGSAFTDSAGKVWLADTGFNTGRKSNVSGVQIAGTSDDILYQTQRWDPSAAPDLTYSLAVTNGNYRVNLHFAETYSGAFGNGLRLFDVYLEDSLQFNNLDIFSAAGGGNRALVVSANNIAVADGKLDIRFSQEVENPTISAIEIISVASIQDTTPPTVPKNFTATADSSSINLSWGASTDDSGFVAGYRIYRDGSQIGSTTTTKYTDSGLASNTSYSYSVRAFDNAPTANLSSPANLSISTLPAVATSGTVIKRINVGGSAFTDSAGNLWLADSGYNTGRIATKSTANILGTTDDLIYQTQRWDVKALPELDYGFNLPNGQYSIRLHFAETYSGNAGVGLRVFNILTENQLAISNLDIFSEAGGINRALVRTIDQVAVTDGQLNIQFQHKTENPTLAAIEIISESSTSIDYTFNSTDLSDWSFVNDSGVTANWSVTNGKLLQSVDTGNQSFGSPMIQSSKVGTFAALTRNIGMNNYQVSADITPRRDSTNRDFFDGQDIGLMFRYQDINNYYRISFNSRESYTRLEKRINGAFTTLAVNSRGYREEQTYKLLVLASGSTIQVSLDNKVLFAVYDKDLSGGSIALYCQDKAEFDNVTIKAPSISPMISIERPLAYSVLTGDQVQAAAVALNAPAGSYVEFDFSGAACGNAQETPAGSGHFITNCGSFSQGDYDQVGLGMAAYLYSATHVLLASDEHLRVGVQGDQYLAVGDSITLGSFDLFAEDNLSQDGRIIGQQGYHAHLNDLLTASEQYPSIIFNTGVGGDRTTHTLNRIDSILTRHSDANRVLLMLGTNDANGSTPLTSATYLSNMQKLVNKAVNKGMSVWVAQIPPSLPYTNFGSVNQRKRDYNNGLNQLTNVQPGPDFYNFFYDDNGTTTTSDDYDRWSMFFDNLHPNALGQQVMAELWHNALTGANNQPFFLDRLCNRLESADCSAISPTKHKQTYLASGYRYYYVDKTYEVVTVPNVLANGIWIQTANNELNNTATQYLSFTVDRPVTVYVAYSAGASSLPNWLSNFSNTGSTLTTNDPLTPTLRLYSRNYNAGAVNLGGNLASGAVGAKSNYVVIVKQR